ncbi:MAG: DHH family phosphoesterase, partial [Candidatus Methanomethylophilaceae archaeon]|nr:DHH family phosphoesterase [Candidatus Methanomethylophilaceae archaeon]
MLRRIVELLTPGDNLFIVHGNADMDAIGTAYALAEAFPKSDIYAPDGIDRVSKTVIEKLGISVSESCDPSSYRLVVVVDTSSPGQLGEGMVLPDNLLVIDHHHQGGKWGDCECYCDPDRISCCEIALDLIDEAGLEINRTQALMLLGGMLTDSGRFQFAKPETLRAFSSVMERGGVCMDEVFDLVENDVTVSERIAVLNAMSRVRTERVGNMIVAISFGSSFEASSCKAIQNAGADVVFVGSQRSDEFRISSRATQDAVRRGVSLGSILNSLGTETGTDGGGHD